MKFNVRDEDGQEYEVEEITSKPVETTDDDMSSLTSDEISALKNLASIATELVALVKGKTSDECETIDDDEEADMTDEEIEEEKVIDTDETDDPKKSKKIGDAKRSIGSLERKRRYNDSAEIDAISLAWAKRYGGK